MALLCIYWRYHPAVVAHRPAFQVSPKILERLDVPMTKINLRKQYPDYYKADTFIEVPDEVAEVMRAFDRQEAAYRRRTYYHNAYYSLDRGDGIEYDAVFLSVTPWEIYERKVTLEQLHAAIATLPDKQAKRIYAHFFLGLTERAIAKSEGVAPSTVHESIHKGLRQMEKFLKKVL